MRVLLKFIFTWAPTTSADDKLASSAKEQIRQFKIFRCGNADRILIFIRRKGLLLNKAKMCSCSFTFQHSLLFPSSFCHCNFFHQINYYCSSSLVVVIIIFVWKAVSTAAKKDCYRKYNKCDVSILLCWDNDDTVDTSQGERWWEWKRRFFLLLLCKKSHFHLPRNSVKWTTMTAKNWTRNYYYASFADWISCVYMYPPTTALSWNSSLSYLWMLIL